MAMKKRWIAVIAPPAIVLFVWLFGEVVMQPWNWLLPPLFVLRMITFLSRSRLARVTFFVNVIWIGSVSSIGSAGVPA